MTEKHILIAEDEEVVRESLKGLLTLSGYQVTAAKDGRQAMELVLEQDKTHLPFDLLITDMMMPGMTGNQLIHRLRELKIDLPILVITGYGTKEMLIELIESGVEDFLEKPFTRKTVCTKIEKVLERRKELLEIRKKNQDELTDHVQNMEEEIRRGLSQDEFVLHYQPIVELATRNIIGFEALIRWNHPEKGMIPPMEFIPVAETTGLIVPIGKWIIRTAISHLHAITEEIQIKKPLILGINVSAKQLYANDLYEILKQELSAKGLDSDFLALEITETSMIENAEKIMPVFSELKELGIRLAIDDFGMGYSSLNYLQNFPFDTLKIDRSFVSTLGTNGNRSFQIIQTIMDLAKRLELDVIAEGIETEMQMKNLLSMNCPYGQGYLFSRPIEFTQAMGLLIQNANADKPRSGFTE